jgi:HEXXH motif-containing protein
MLFGAILLNVNGHETVLQMIEALIHESSHNLLFGLCADGPMIDNLESERYDSPLRFDPRPMDGIVHATYVLARMYQGIRRLLDSGCLNRAQIEEARAMLAASASKYGEGWCTVSRHAQLTPLGERVMQAAHDYMTHYMH